MQLDQYLDRRDFLGFVKDALEFRLAYLETFYRNGGGLEEIGRVMEEAISVKDETDELDYVWTASGDGGTQTDNRYPAWMTDRI